MKQLYLLLLLWVPYAHAQTAIINEFSSDPSMYDGSGGEFVELHCPAGGGACDISCWVISDGQGIITIPNGTTIPDGGFYLIAHAPAFNCDSCDFFGKPVDLNTATCGCLNGGSYGNGIDGNPSFIIGRSGNAGELMLLYDNLGALQESWSFDNASAAFSPTGVLINGKPAGACPATSTLIPPSDSSIITDVGATCLGCNSSYTRDTDGSGTWIVDNHPTPGASNANMGDNAFLYQYRLNDGTWITIPKTGPNNIDTHKDTVCTGDSIQFRIQIENYQHAVLEVFDSSGRYGSYFRSPTGGIMAWATVEGLSTALDDTIRLVSSYEPIAIGNSIYKLQWSDYKDGLGSFSSTSSNECYERMNFTLVRHQTLDSATVTCADPTSGITATTAYPIGIDGHGTDIFYVLYDDIGDFSNPINSNQSGAFQLTNPATVNYYIQVEGPCNNVVAIDLGAFCLAVPPCPQIDTSSYEKNSASCGTVIGVIFQEDFESGGSYDPPSIPECTDNGGDYFLLTDGSNINATFTGVTGSYFAAQDIDAAGCPAGGLTETITWTGINISGQTGLQLSIDAAEDDDGSNQDWDGPDFVHIEVSIDGGAFVDVIWFEATGTTTNFTGAQDTDFDGLGDGTVLTDAFQTFMNTITGTGTTMDIRITFHLDSGDEDIAIDNLTLSGTTIDTCQACPNDTLSFSVAGTNLPMGGNIDWYYDTTAGFSPYNGDGTYIGSSPIPLPEPCSSPTLVINEFVTRPTTNNGVDPFSGEMIELLGPPGMDIGCFVITDGDWTITIPPGTVIPPDGIFTIGNDGVHGAGTFDLDAEACGCFTDIGGGGGLLILTDGGEYFGVYDASGAFVQGITYGSPSGVNTPPNGQSSVGGVINTVGLVGCQTSITIASSGYENATSPGSGSSAIRNPDGNGPWSNTATPSINDCNVAFSIPPVPDLDYIVPIEACDETRIYKGIIVPHPNTVACPNTDPSAFTDEFVIQVVCPDAHIEGDFTICETSLPLSVPVTTTDITSGTAGSFVYTIDGVLDTVAGTITNDTLFFNPTVTGTYDGLQIIPATGCLDPADSFATITIIPTPDAPAIPSPLIVCEGDTALLTASGAPTFEWSLASNFSPIDTTNSDYLVAAPDSIFVRSINQDDSARVNCPGATSATAITTIICDVITLAQNLVAFDATKADKKALLEWQWQANINHRDFYIERSANGITFEQLGTVAPISNSNGALQYYQLIDENPINGWNYYRLRYPENDIDYQYSQIRALNFGEASAVVSVYPSPTKGVVTISFADLLNQAATIKIYDVLGQVVLSSKVPKNIRQYELNLSELPAAVYVVSVKIGVATQNIRVVKQ